MAWEGTHGDHFVDGQLSKKRGKRTPVLKRDQEVIYVSEELL